MVIFNCEYPEAFFHEHYALANHASLSRLSHDCIRSSLKAHMNEKTKVVLNVLESPHESQPRVLERPPSLLRILRIEVANILSNPPA